MCSPVDTFANSRVQNDELVDLDREPILSAEFRWNPHFYYTSKRGLSSRQQKPTWPFWTLFAWVNGTLKLVC